MSAYCLRRNKFMYNHSSIHPAAPAAPHNPKLGLCKAPHSSPLVHPFVWPPVQLVEPHQQHITAPQCRYKLEEFGGSLKWTPPLTPLTHRDTT